MIPFVYIVLYTVVYESTDIMGVFEDEDDAKDAVKELVDSIVAEEGEYNTSHHTVDCVKWAVNTSVPLYGLHKQTE